MHPSRLTLASLSFLIIVAPSASFAQGKGEGACVIRPDAPFYAKANSKKPAARLKPGDCFVGVTTRGILGDEYIFEEEKGRLHVVYLAGKEEGGIPHYAWVDPPDVSRFTYECGCGSSPEARANCSPFSGMFSFVYNPCYKAARAKNLAEVAKGGSSSATSDTTGRTGGPAVRPGPAEKPLTNSDIVALSKAGLGDDLILSKIKQAPAEAFDVSTEALIQLTKDGISKGVLDAMVKRAAAGGGTTPVPDERR